MNDGGQAFPSPMGDMGMNLRDYFASHATEQDIAQFVPRTSLDLAEFVRQNNFFPSRQWARYAHADAMLKARELRS